MSLDKQTIGAAGEFLTAGKLFKLGLQVCVTYGNAKSVDILAYNPQINKSYTVQVKTQATENRYLLKPQDVRADTIYVFVRLNDENENERFFVIDGATLLADVAHFWGASSRQNSGSRPGLNYGPLNSYENKWDFFKR